MEETYADFERRVLEPLLKFRHDHDPDQLQSSAAALMSLGREHIEGARLSETQEFRAVGWVLPSRHFRLSKRTLEKINPAYRIRIRRLPRRELGWRGRVFRPGFLITAVGPKHLPPFVLRLAGMAGLTQLPPSNLDAAFAIRTVNEAHPELSAVTATVRGPIGFVDAAIISPVPDPSDRSTWFAALLHKRPAEVFEIVDSSASGMLGEAAVRLFRSYPLNARWADRFTMAVKGAQGTYESDLLALRIVRLDVPAGSAGQEGLPLPVPTRAGQVVSWKAGSKRLPIPTTDWLHFSNAAVQDGGTVTTDDSLLVYEHAADPANDFVAGQWQTVFGSSANREIALIQARPPSQETIPEGILISGRNDNNWFHWLIEYLPRVLMIPEDIGTQVPIVVSTRTPITGRQALAELTDRPVIEVDPLVRTRFGMLHVLAPPVQVHDTTKIPWQDGLRMDPSAILRLRRAWDSAQTASRRVFLQRRSQHRGIVNEAALAEVALRHGLEIVDPSALSFDAQRELFASTELLVGASGAAMANYIFMQPGSVILALTSDQLFDFVLPAALAQIAGAEFTYVTGPSIIALDEVEDRNHWIHADFSVDAATFEQELKAAIQRLNRRGQVS